MSTYSIKDMESLSGIKAHTIRIWEKRYELIKPERTTTNIRLYNVEELKHLINVSSLVKQGHKISKISKLDKTEVAELLDKNTSKPNNYESLISKLIDSMVELNENSFLQLFDSSIQNIGFEYTISDVIFPLLERIGAMWTVGAIVPGQEHFISNLIRQKIIKHIDLLPIQINPVLPKFILFLPEGEWHEIGLLFMNYLLKKRSFGVFYLGSSVSEKDLIEIFKIRDIKYLFTILTTAYQSKSIPNYINEISKIIEDRTLIITGQASIELTSKPDNVKVIKDFNEVYSFIKELTINA